MCIFVHKFMGHSTQELYKKMVLQRIQTVYLLLAAILMATFAFFPVYDITCSGTTVAVSALPRCGISLASLVILCLDALIVLLTLIAIFKYNDLKKQMRLTGVIMLLIVTLITTISIMLCMNKCPSVVTIHITAIIPFVSLVLVALAYKGMKHDKKLLADSERIR